MSTKNNECRFCLRVVRRGEKLTIIDDMIKRQFGDLTQIPLKNSFKFSRVICEMCLRSLQMATTLKKQLTDNQRRLELECEDYDEEEHEQFVLNYDPLYVSRSTQKRQNESIESSSQPAKRKRNIKEEPEESFAIHEHTNEEISQHHEQEDDEDYFDNASNNSDNFDFNEKGKTKFRCFHCEKVFCSSALRKRHILTGHVKQRFPCVFPECTSEIRRLDYFKDHFLRAHKHMAEGELAEMLEKVKLIKPVFQNEGLRLE